MYNENNITVNVDDTKMGFGFYMNSLKPEYDEIIKNFTILSKYVAFN